MCSKTMKQVVMGNVGSYRSLVALIVSDGVSAACVLCNVNLPIHLPPTQHHPWQPLQWNNTGTGVTPAPPVNTEPVCVAHVGAAFSSDWLASSNVARDRKHSPSLSNNYPSLHADCQRANSSVIIPLLPVESGWQRAQYQSHSITLLLPFISSTLSSTMKDAGFYFTLKLNVSACSRSTWAVQ